MKKRIIKNLIVFAALLLMMSLSIAKAETDFGLGGATPDEIKTSKVSTASNAGTDMPGLIGHYVGIALSFLGVGFFLIVLYAGYKWMFARGNTKDTDAARDMLVDAVIGLVIIFGAYAITAFVGGRLAADN